MFSFSKKRLNVDLSGLHFGYELLPFIEASTDEKFMERVLSTISAELVNAEYIREDGSWIVEKPNVLRISVAFDIYPKP